MSIDKSIWCGQKFLFADFQYSWNFGFLVRLLRLILHPRFQPNDTPIQNIFEKEKREEYDGHPHDKVPQDMRQHIEDLEHAIPSDCSYRFGNIRLHILRQSMRMDPGVDRHEKIVEDAKDKVACDVTHTPSCSDCNHAISVEELSDITQDIKHS